MDDETKGVLRDLLQLQRATLFTLSTIAGAQAVMLRREIETNSRARPDTNDATLLIVEQVKQLMLFNNQLLEQIKPAPPAA